MPSGTDKASQPEVALDPGRVWLRGTGADCAIRAYPAVQRAIRNAVAGADYCVLCVARYALIVDFREREAHEFYTDPGIEVLRAKNPTEALRPLLAYVLPGLDATLLHAAALHDPSGCAFVLMGPSGAGKSTAASLREPGQVLLGDDRVVVSREPDGFWVGATPFNRATSGPGAAPIGALAWLEQGPTFALERVPWLHLLSNVWLNNATEWFPVAPVLRKRYFRLFCALLRGTPLFRLTFARDFVDWDALRAAIGMVGHARDKAR